MCQNHTAPKVHCTKGTVHQSHSATKAHCTKDTVHQSHTAPKAHLTSIFRCGWDSVLVTWCDSQLSPFLPGCCWKLILFKYIKRRPHTKLFPQHNKIIHPKCASSQFSICLNVSQVYTSFVQKLLVIHRSKCCAFVHFFSFLHNINLH